MKFKIGMRVNYSVSKGVPPSVVGAEISDINQEGGRVWLKEHPRRSFPLHLITKYIPGRFIPGLGR